MHVVRSCSHVSQCSQGVRKVFARCSQGVRKVFARPIRPYLPSRSLLLGSGPRVSQARRAQVRTAVRKALGEFRRTHEEAALAAARRALDPDQWEALQEVASPATYFA